MSEKRVSLLFGSVASQLVALSALGLASCSESGGELEEPVGVVTAAATKEEKPPIREIAVVLDGGGGMGPRCEYDKNSVEYGYNEEYDYDYFVRYHATACSPFNGFDEQRLALIDAVRGLPTDGTIALTVVQSANRRRLDDIPSDGVIWRFDGPITLVPYTVIRSEADLNSINRALSAAEISLDEHEQHNAFPGLGCHNFDSATGTCYGDASHSWAANVAWRELTQCDVGAPDAGAVDDDSSERCKPRGEKQELCMLGALAETVGPYDERGTRDWVQPDYVPWEAYWVAPHVTLEQPDLDRVTAVAYTPGPVPHFRYTRGPYLGNLTGDAALDEHWLHNHYWGASLRFTGEVEGSTNLTLNLGYGGRVRGAPVIHETTVNVFVTFGMTAVDVAQQVEDVLVSLGDTIPVFCDSAKGELFCYQNHNFNPDDIMRVDGVETWLPDITVDESVDGLSVEKFGGSRWMPDRVIEDQDVSVRHSFVASTELIDNENIELNLIFPSGYMRSDLRDEAVRLNDFTRSVSACFEEKPEIRAIEVTQGIQDWTNSVPLIEGKKTSVRVFAAHLQPEHADDARRDGAAIELMLVGYRPNPTTSANCIEEPASCVQLSPNPDDLHCASKFDCAITGFHRDYRPPATPEEQREDIRTSEIFDLPPHWLTGDLVLNVLRPGGELECGEPLEGLAELNENTVAKDCGAFVRFTAPNFDERLVGVTPFIIDWIDGAQDRFSEDRIEEGLAAAEHMLPLSRLRSRAPRQMIVRYETASPFKDNNGVVLPLPPNGSSSQHDAFVRYGLHMQMQLVRALECRPPADGESIEQSCPDPNVFMGGFAINSPSSLGGVEKMGALLVDFSDDTIDTSGSTATHELMHAYGRQHPNYCLRAEDSDQIAKCAEPHPFEFDLFNFADPVTRVQSLPNLPVEHPNYDSLRPAIGYLNVDDPDRTVWGFDRGYSLRHRNGSDEASSGISALNPLATWDVASYCDRGGARLWPSRFQWERLFDDHTGTYTNIERSRSDSVVLPGGFRSFIESPARPRKSVHGFFCDLSLADGLTACSFGTGCEDDRVCLRFSTEVPCALGDLDCYCVAPSRTEPSDAARSAVLFRGWVTSSISASEFKAVATVPMLQAAPAYFSQDRGEFKIALRDANGVLLYEIEVNAPESSEQGAESEAVQSIVSLVPHDPNVASFTLSRGDVELSTIAASPNRPVVAVESHEANDSIGDGIEVVSWTASDNDDDELRYTVWYSPDGATWQVLAIEYPDTSIEIDTRLLAGSDNAFLRVSAADQTSAGDDAVGPLHVPFKNPRATVRLPLDDASFVGDQVILFEAQAIDQEEGWIEDTLIEWSSDIDGPLGQGPQSRLASQLTPGPHTITARVVDGSGAIGEASVSIEVVRFNTRIFEGGKLDLSIEPSGNFQIGVTASYEVQLQNIGADATEEGTVVITLPAELAYESASGEDWSCSAADQVVTCEYEGEPLEPAFSAPPITIEVMPSDGGIDPLTRSSYSVTTTGEATFVGAPSVRESVSTSVRIPIPPQLGASIIVRDTPATGQPGNYSFTVSNSGGPADMVEVTFSVPTGAVFTQGSGTGWVCELLGAQAVCTYEAPLLGGEELPTLTVTVVVQDPELTRVALTYSMRALSRTPSIHFDGGFDGGADAALDPVIIESGGEGPGTDVTPTQTAGVDLRVSVMEQCEQFGVGYTCVPAHWVFGTPGGYVFRDAARRRGGTWSHVIGVRNRGTLAAADPIVVTDQLPVGAQYFPRPLTDWECAEQDRLVTCEYTGAPLRPGYSTALRIHYTIDVDAPSTLTNVVSVTTDDDLDTSNDTVSYTVDVLDRVCTTSGARSRCYDYPPPLVASGLDV